MQSLMRLVFVLSAVFLMSGCGKNRLPIWPAYVASLEGFDGPAKQALLSALQYFNQRAGDNFVLLEQEKGKGGFPIHFHKVELDPANPKRAGLATMEEDKCTIELVSNLFKGNKVSTLIPVVLHEIGHCAGLSHEAARGEIMFATAEPLSYYSDDAIKRFLESAKATPRPSLD